MSLSSIVGLRLESIRFFDLVELTFLVAFLSISFALRNVISYCLWSFRDAFLPQKADFALEGAAHGGVGRRTKTFLALLSLEISVTSISESSDKTEKVSEKGDETHVAEWLFE